jgi:hypothetical protein
VKVSDFHYDLPVSSIAQSAIEVGEYDVFAREAVARRAGGSA